MTEHLRVRTRRLDEPVELLRHLSEEDGAAWVRGGDGLIGLGEAVDLTPGNGPERFARTRQRLDDLASVADVDDEVGLPGTGLVAFTSLTFSDRSPASVAVVPQVVLGQRDGVAWVTSVSVDGDAVDPVVPDELGPPPGPQDRPRFAGSSLPDLHWLVRVADAVERLGTPELDKVVLARDHALWAKAPFHVRGVASRLASRFPDCFTFAVRGLVGATPELLLRRTGREVESEALAGTTGRSDDPARDAELGRALAESDKDQWEHRLAADSVDEVLRPRCVALERTGTYVKRLENVQHLATSFVGQLRDDVHLLDLVAELHPTAAVGGTPRRAALELIEQLEGMDRGRYAGPVGWVDAHGDGELGIALRCAELSGARARLFAGGGIVADSLPEDELEETRIKLLAMQSVLGRPD